MEGNLLFDLIVIGGGINGAGIARDAALRGFKVILFEKNDFASGTSSKTTKLIHGGLRYLEQFNFKLIFQSCQERYLLRKLAPHLVHPLPFIIPIYKNSKRTIGKIKAGMVLYDFLAAFRNTNIHRMLSAEETHQYNPHLKKEGLLGSAFYYDCQTNDARLVLENILQAKEKGAQVHNYTEVVEFIIENGKAVGVKVRDKFSRVETLVKGKAIINAGGPWVDKILDLVNLGHQRLIRPTKGIHLVAPKLYNNKEALFVSAGSDNRMFFIIPWQEYSLIGTTDTDYLGNPDEVTAEKEDIEYLIGETKRVLPKIDFDSSKIISSYAGLRPLINVPNQKSSFVSREHMIVEDSSGIFSAIGGKLTTYRLLAKEAVDKAVEKLSPLTSILSPLGRGSKKAVFSHQMRELNECQTDKIPLWGGNIENFDNYLQENIETKSKEFNIEESIVRNLIFNYGTKFENVLELAKEDRTLKERLCPHHLHIKAEVVYARKFEEAKTLDDFLYHRTFIGIGKCRGLDCKKQIEALL